MGQMTYGILLGVPAPEDDEALLEEWAEVNKTKIKKSPLSYWEARSQIVPDFEGEGEGDIPYLGFWVAAGASGKDGVDYLEGFPLDDIASKYGKAIKAAKKRWQTFVDWAAAKGVNLPEAKLYLLETEVA